jgi:hypothetical protein
MDFGIFTLVTNVGAGSPKAFILRPKTMEQRANLLCHILLRTTYCWVPIVIHIN